jgi:Carboxypeptidase regulatory-like domain
MKTWLAAVALFASLTAAAQATVVAGTVVDARTQQPIVGANVTVVLDSDALPLHATTDAGGRFSVEASATPARVSLERLGFEPYAMALASLAPSDIADLRIALNVRLVLIEELRTRSACAPFQPGQLWDRYVLAPGACGMPKR